MEVAHIYIYGIIDYFQDEHASEWGFVNLKDVKNQFDAQKEGAKEIHVHIHSDGGDVDEGFAIHDFIKAQGLPVTTINEGNCHSIASVVFMSGTTRKMNANSSMLIHLPSGGVHGNSEEVAKYSEKLNDARDKIAKMYDANTTLSEVEVLDHMKNEKEFNAEEAVTFGFATEKNEQLKAVALFRKKKENNQNNMADEAIKNELKSGFGRLENLFKKFLKPKALMVTDADGAEIDFPDVEGRDPEVGDKANVGESPADGDYLMPDGKTYVFASGELTEIKEAEEETDEEMENLKTENETLKADNQALADKVQALETKNSESEEGLKAMNTEFKALKEKVTSELNLGKPKGSSSGDEGEGGKPTSRTAGLKQMLSEN